MRCLALLSPVDNINAAAALATSFSIVRWDNLFDDLEGQLEHELRAEEVDLRAEEERLRLGRLSLRDRLLSLSAGPNATSVSFTLVLASGVTLHVRPVTFGKDWLAADLVSSADAQCVVPFTWISGVVLTGAQIENSLDPPTESAARVIDRIGFPFVLRDLCRRRKSVELHTTDGTVTGTIDRVGRDHLDLAVHAPGTLRRSREVLHYRIVPLAQVQQVRVY